MNILNNLKLAASALALTGLLAGANSGEATADRVNWKMGSAFPSKLVQLGSGGVNLSERLEAMSGGDIRITDRSIIQIGDSLRERRWHGDATRWRGNHLCP